MSSERWLKICLHAHTTESDGDEPLDRVIDWYRRLGFDCLVVTDHNLVTLPDGESPERPLLIGGEEVTVMLEGESVAVYVNGVGLREAVEPIVKDGVLATLQANVDAVVRAGGIPCLTSPYYREGFDHHTLAGIEGAVLMDIYNAHPNNVLGDPRTFSYERLWDEALTAGRRLFGVATDDAHNYREFSADNSNPGRAWVMARCSELTEESVLEALRSGDFYASTGVKLTSLEVEPGSVSLAIEPKTPQSYSTAFLGRGGRLLSEQKGTEADYRFEGGEGYVRARVTSSWGARAWTQPVFVG